MKTYNRWVEGGTGFSWNYIAGAVLALLNAGAGLFFFYGTTTPGYGFINVFIGLIPVVAMAGLIKDSCPGSGDWVISVRGREIAPSEIAIGAGASSLGISVVFIIFIFVASWF